MFDVKPITTPRPTDCGATCLAMLLDYYGQEYDLDALTRECRTTVAGCSAADVNRAGRAHGLDMKAWEMSAESALRNDRPAIIWWRYNHFVVLCGTDENGQVVICNPDRGRYRISPGTFKSFFTKVALTNGEVSDLPGGEAE